MSTNTSTVNSGRVRQPATGVGRLVRRLERERRTWVRHLTHDGPMVATEQAGQTAARRFPHGAMT